MKRLLLAIVFSVAAGAARAGTLDFTLQGTNPGGKSGYQGTVSLTEVSTGANGAKAGVVVWRVNRSDPVKGIALMTDDSPTRLSISFPNNPTPGVALGTLMDDGSVRLTWFIGGETAGTEVWLPKH